MACLAEQSLGDDHTTAVARCPSCEVVRHTAATKRVRGQTEWRGEVGIRSTHVSTYHYLHIINVVIKL